MVMRKESNTQGQMNISEETLWQGDAKADMNTIVWQSWTSLKHQNDQTQGVEHTWSGEDYWGLSLVGRGFDCFELRTCGRGKTGR